MNYAFTHEGKGFKPDGSTPLPATEVQDHNAELERAEIERLKTGPEKVFLYVKVMDKGEKFTGAPPYYSLGRAQITTWLGTVLEPNATLGPARKFRCFGPFPSVRRAVTCTLFGVKYVGWYFESSGDYCRLRKAKRQ